MKKKSTNTLTLQERGLLDYIEKSPDADGLFGQRMSVIAKACATSRPVIHRVIHSLIEKRQLKVVRESVRGKDGYPSPLVLRSTRTVKIAPSPLADSAHASCGVSDQSPQTVANKSKSISGHIYSNNILEGGRSVGYVDSESSIGLGTRVSPSPESPRVCQHVNGCKKTVALYGSLDWWGQYCSTEHRDASEVRDDE
jgi:hypothetical protein